MSSIKLITWKMFFMLRMKKFFFIIGVYFFVYSFCIFSNRIYVWPWRRKVSFCIKLKMNTLDTHKCDAYYKVAFLNDSTKRNDYTKGLCLLSFSDRYVRFGDYYAVLADSINDLCAKTRKMHMTRKLDDAIRLRYLKKCFISLR